MNAMITPKIVDITGNAATEAFVGKSVTKRNTANGIVYAIGNTGYVLSSAEYRMFAAAGAIAAGTSQQKPKKKPSKHAGEPKKKVVAQQTAKPKAKSKQSAAKPKAAAKSVDKTRRTSGAKAAAKNIASIAAHEEEAPVDAYTFGPDTTGYLETSPFLLNYPTPEFSIDEPKRGLFDRSEDFGKKVSNFFDRLGQRGRDKIVSSIETEADEIEE